MFFFSLVARRVLLVVGRCLPQLRYHRVISSQVSFLDCDMVHVHIQAKVVPARSYVDC